MEFTHIEVENNDTINTITRKKTSPKKTYEGLQAKKKGFILNNISQINDLINKTLSNNDYLMVKGSNSTGLHKQSKILKSNKLNVL